MSLLLPSESTKTISRNQGPGRWPSVSGGWAPFLFGKAILRMCSDVP